jgi:hypothetical protein
VQIFFVRVAANPKIPAAHLRLASRPEPESCQRIVRFIVLETPALIEKI